MDANQMIDQFCSQSAGFVVLAVDDKGGIVAKSSAVPLTLSLAAAQSKTEVLPKDLLKTIQVVEALTKEQQKSRRGRKPGKKQAQPDEKVPEPVKTS